MNEQPCAEQFPHIVTQLTFPEFLAEFIGGLANPTFDAAGALDEYLATPEELRGGDEANVVDFRVTSRLLKALGYAENEINYNAQHHGVRPDFVVRIPEYPLRACFVVEDKSTATHDLPSHRPQLHGYMSQNRAPRGLLIDGNLVLAYDHQESVQTPAIEINLEEAVKAWRGALLLAAGKTGIDALDQIDLLPQLAALWRRHRRESFAGIQVLIDDLTLQNDGTPHNIDGSTWKPEHTRIPIVPVTEQPDDLTGALRSIIAELEDDAGAQLAAFEKEFTSYTSAAQTIPGESGTLSQQEETIVGDVLALCPDESLDLRERLESLTRQVVNAVVPADNVTKIHASLCEVHGVRESGGSKPILQLTQRISGLAIKKRLFLEKLREQYSDSIRVHDSYAYWKDKSARVVFQSSDEKKLRREFLAQTAYLIVIRILLVRIMEDKALTNRVFTNGGVSLWFRQVEPHYLEHATGRGTQYLLDLAYSSAQYLYAHFYSEKTVLDWYRPDRNAVVRLLHTLAGFDFKHIDRDIIGAVYNEYVEAEHKHESGLYYTPKVVVEYMLDRVGYKSPNILQKKLIDLASGSGGFLVSAAKRLVDAHREYWKAQGFDDIPADRVHVVLDDVRNSLFGVDLNPFACALAETNLLIQVIDLIAIAIKAHEPASTDKFHIYNSDTLSFSVETRRHLYGTLTFPVTELPIEDQIKAGIGAFTDKFDFVVGNPPYVKANENEYLKSYRARVKEDHPLDEVKKVLEKKWDLYVPFVAQSLALVKQDGRMALITSNAIETVPYAEALRRHLVRDSSICEIHFFPHVKLFQDVEIYNTIFVLTKSAPTESHIVARFFHDAPPSSGQNVRVQKLSQAKYGVDVFRQNLPMLKIKESVDTAPLDHIFYLSKGMVLHGNYNGAFTIDELLSDVPDASHSAPFVGSKDVDEFGIRRIRFLEYGANTRVPEHVYRPTFPELYDRDKLMVAEFGGYAFDNGKWHEEGHLKCNHSVFILLPWHLLHGVENRSIKDEVKELGKARHDLESISSSFNAWYVLGFLNSDIMHALLRGVARSAIANRLQPDDLRQIFVPVPTAELAEKVAKLSQKAAKAQKSLLAFRSKGWQIESDTIKPPATVPSGVQTKPLALARVSWQLNIHHPTAKTGSLRREGLDVFRGTRRVLSVPDGTPQQALDWLVHQFNALPNGMTFESTEQEQLLVPATPTQGAKALGKLNADIEVVKNLVQQIASMKADISGSLADLFEEVKHPSIEVEQSPQMAHCVLTTEVPH